MPRARKPKSLIKTRIVALRVPDTLYVTVDRAARAIGTTKSQMICNLLERQRPMLLGIVKAFRQAEAEQDWGLIEESRKIADRILREGDARKRKKK